MTLSIRLQLLLEKRDQIPERKKSLIDITGIEQKLHFKKLLLHL